jgi:hypothetical protein
MPDVIQSPSCNAGYVQVPRDRTISIPSPDSDREMAIRCADWTMLERRLSSLLIPPKDYSNLYSALFGIGGSALLYLIPLAFTKDIPAWVLWLYGTFTAIFLLCGAFTFFLSRDYRNTRNTMMTALLEDIKEIGSRFTPGSIPGGQIIDETVVEDSSQANP